VEVKMIDYGFLCRQQNLTMQSILAGESGTALWMNMSGMSDCLFSAYSFIGAG
jgi:hypothetical protein